MNDESGQKAVWDAIAASFDRTRTQPWRHVDAFLATIPQRARVLDLMSGNGRHRRAPGADGLDLVALDWSWPLLEAGKAPHASVQGDALHLPFQDAVFDACVFVAGLHGLPEAGQRVLALRELRRVLRPGAPAQVTVWSRAAPRFRDLPADQFDVTVPWKADGLHEDRSYHLYTNDTLRIHLLAAGFQVEDVRAVAIAGAEPDNLVAWARA